jgi:hypothetical protein
MNMKPCSICREPFPFEKLNGWRCGPCFNAYRREIYNKKKETLRKQKQRKSRAFLDNENVNKFKNRYGVLSETKLLVNLLSKELKP